MSVGAPTGSLTLVATPIGSARDITLRALDILRDADVLVAEDTRTLRKLMQIHGIPVGGRPVLAYHDHNGAAMRPRLLDLIREGRSVAYASDAGTPLIADPGYALAREATLAGLRVTTAPGASAVLTALSLSGLPTDRFLFAGFLPPTDDARATALAELASVPATLVFYEAPSRCARMLDGLLRSLGDRDAALCRELTKKFEEVRRGPLSVLLAGCQENPPRGEIVIVVDRDRSVASSDDIDADLRHAMQTMSVKDAATTIAGARNVPRREVYQRALRMQDRE
ncbi:tetrapyrrole methylase [Oceaniovalibus guishaninsula JLT2003]|uniref:Ribosomal RNA small subunit methyltransferase I n=1 Tax=Oceaniovalibus guishaninsula JLT2003 TaxID=1231392 RepID=K2HB15_9RHOB|nr:16S rRNA (cytidine(1402)-2'-O)-methyltransferase [Oceaniovalibus guishaninsula]EKE43862.1 tetrapyrrole methylase [Oceaniovalibus guishaninsula JLT2003]